MKRLILWAALPALLLTACNCQNTPDEEGLLTVRAEAEVRVPPDRAALGLAVTHRTSDLQAGREYMLTTLQNLQNYLKEQGTQAKNFKIQQIRITPLYRDAAAYSAAGANASGVQTQYEFEQSFTVTLEDPAQYEALLYGLLERGVNRVEGVEFYSSDMRKYRDQARLDALKAAQEKAHLLARAAGVKTGKIISLEETTAPVYFLSAANAVQNISSDAIGQELGTGLISVKASVSLSYEIE